MVKHTQTIRQLLPTDCMSVFDHFVGLALKGLTLTIKNIKPGYDKFSTGTLIILNETKFIEHMLEATFKEDPDNQ